MTKQSNIDRARHALAENPNITGADLGRMLGLTERQGRNIRSQIAGSAQAANEGHTAEAERLLAEAGDALRDDNAERAARLATIASAHALMALVERLAEPEYGAALHRSTPEMTRRAAELLPAALRLDRDHLAVTGKHISSTKLREALRIDTNTGRELSRILKSDGGGT